MILVLHFLSARYSCFHFVCLCKSRQTSSDCECALTAACVNRQGGNKRVFEEKQSGWVLEGGWDET